MKRIALWINRTARPFDTRRKRKSAATTDALAEHNAQCVKFAQEHPNMVSLLWQPGPNGEPLAKLYYIGPALDEDKEAPKLPNDPYVEYCGNLVIIRSTPSTKQ
ncbi:hypothetical protein [Paraburkholderia heleia]|uniref:hypothetical protein n=1 Tax=Paraburkholderia heleia TaxID=634127 RepID=UPI002AB7F2FD|nr:hypothetical protein [Paraburkholderia heleia]